MSFYGYDILQEYFVVALKLPRLDANGTKLAKTGSFIFAHLTISVDMFLLKTVLVLNSL